MSSVVIRRDVGGGLLSSNNEPGVPHISDVRDAYVSVFTDNQVQILFFVSRNISVLIFHHSHFSFMTLLENCFKMHSF